MSPDVFLTKTNSIDMCTGQKFGLIRTGSVQIQVYTQTDLLPNSHALSGAAHKEDEDKTIMDGLSSTTHPKSRLHLL